MNTHRQIAVLPTLITVLLLAFFTSYSQNDTPHAEELTHFINLISSTDKKEQLADLKYIDKNWKPEYEIMILELFYFKLNTVFGNDLLKLLEKKTYQNFSYDFNAWYAWIWNKKERLIPEYHKFKAALHANIDKRFPKYFLNRQDASKRTIRLDEVRWGGVLQDGIPPLRNPEMIAATDANYLQDSNIVFGIEVNGDFRAYPKRILAWHEMFTDRVGGVDVAGVYCTLCGTVILYKTEHKGIKYKVGTSGFLYRSNKLMYDQKTQSLWNTLWGTPVLGPLVGKGITFEYLSVVTTTWAEWKKRHPNTKVLNLSTGFKRNYDEGIAYKNYFATDDVMFNVPKLSNRLKNKASILAIRFPELQEKPLAISVQYLKKHPVYHGRVGDRKFVVLTDKTGANRVFNTAALTFKTYDQQQTVTDENNQQWTVYENRLENDKGDVLERIHTFNAFWFGWKAAYPNTRLVK